MYRTHLARVATFLAVAALLLPVSVWLYAQNADAALPGPDEVGKAFAAVAKRVTPAIVNINTSRIIPGRVTRFDDPFFRSLFPEFGELFREPARKVTGLGSGVIVDPRGYIVTNHHVVANMEEIRVMLADNRESEATVIGTDPATDIAVVKIDGTDLPVATWGDSDAIEVGEWVLAIGSPFGLSQTVTAGIISAKGRPNPEVASYVDFLQTDADINPGNSGGALVDTRGEVVGINSAIFSATGGSLGIGFAVPSNTAREVMTELLANGRVVRGWAGVLVERLTSKEARDLPAWARNGLLVNKLVRNSPADAAGVAPGDVITAINGRPPGTPSQLRDAIAHTQPGRSISLDVHRAETGTRARVTLRLIDQPRDRQGRPFPGI